MQRTLPLALVALLAPCVAGADIVRGPYLQSPGTDRITILAETDLEQECLVRWGEGFAQSTALVAEGTLHEGTIEGLAPSRCYPYRLECGDARSADLSFCSAAKPKEPFSFVVFGDTRSGHDAHRALVRAIEAEGVDFYINTGDLVSDGDVRSLWDTFFEIEGPLMAQVPLYPVVGNHDQADSVPCNYTTFFAPPTTSSGDERYYAFDYGNARFLVLDNQGATLGRPEDETDQGRWLAAELERARADPPAHLFVLVHANMYSGMDSRSGDEGLRLWADAMLEAGVDFVFSGHDHHYLRGWAGNGLPFLVSGGGGASLYDIREELLTQGEPIETSVYGWLPEPGERPFTVVYATKANHYVRVDVRGGRFSAVTKEVVPGTEDPATELERFGPGGLPVTQGGGCSCGQLPGSSLGLLLLAAAALWLIGRRRLA